MTVQLPDCRFRAGRIIVVTTTPCFADTVLLKNGRLITGKVLREDGDRVTIEVLDGQGKLTIHKATIARV